jgi:hypothetical protein
MSDEDRTPSTLGALDPIPYENDCLLKESHNHVVGHGGIQRTRRNVLRLNKQANNDDHQLTRHVRQSIRGCFCCQKMSQIKPYPYTLSTRTPMDTVSVDTLGTFPVDEDDNKYVIVIIDCFSKFVELHPTKDLTAERAARCMFHYMWGDMAHHHA